MVLSSARDCSSGTVINYQRFLQNDKVFLEKTCNKCSQVSTPYMTHVFVVIVQNCSMQFPPCHLVFTVVGER